MSFWNDVALYGPDSPKVQGGLVLFANTDIVGEANLDAVMNAVGIRKPLIFTTINKDVSIHAYVHGVKHYYKNGSFPKNEYEIDATIYTEGGSARRNIRYNVITKNGELL